MLAHFLNFSLKEKCVIIRASEEFFLQEKCEHLEDKVLSIQPILMKLVRAKGEINVVHDCIIS